MLIEWIEGEMEQRASRLTAAGEHERERGHVPDAPARQPIVNGLSVDVEDWFQVGAFENVIDRDEWDGAGRPRRAQLRRGARPVRRGRRQGDLLHPGLGRRSAIRALMRADRRRAATRSPATAGTTRRVFTMDRASFAADLAARAQGDRGCRRGRASPAIARRASRSTAHALGVSWSWPSRAMPIPRASRRSATTIMAGPRRRASPSGRCRGRR